jgi:hypothetical protein
MHKACIISTYPPRSCKRGCQELKLPNIWNFCRWQKAATFLQPKRGEIGDQATASEFLLVDQLPVELGSHVNGFDANNLKGSSWNVWITQFMWETWDTINIETFQ